MHSTLKNPFPQSIKHIAVVSFSGKPEKTKVISSCGKLNRLGIKTTIMPNVFAEEQGVKLPSSCELRVSDFNGALSDSSVDLILSSRGGYGAAQLLGRIDWELLRKRNISVLGYSDITAFHLAMFSKNAGIAVSSPMAAEFSEALGDLFTMNSLSAALGEKNSENTSILRQKDRLKIVKKGNVSGGILPVNLAVLASMVGTGFLPDFKGKILLLEDVNEPVYKLDRYLTQLELAGILSECSAVLFGIFKRCGNENERTKIFAKFAECVNGPVLAGLPFGHIRSRLCIRFGVKINVSDENVSYV